LFVRPIRIIGIFLSTVAVYLAFNWFLNTLVPLNRLNGLQPTKASTLIDKTIETPALFECYVSPEWASSMPNLLLNCDGQEVQVQRHANEVRNLPPLASGSSGLKAIAKSDPVVVIGQMASDRRQINQLELVAYGNRDTNLTTFQSDGIMQIFLAEVVGLLGLLALFIDWRIGKARRARRMAAWQAEQAYATPSSKPMEKSTQHNRR
jgi:hypothetical protein